MFVRSVVITVFAVLSINDKRKVDEFRTKFYSVCSRPCAKHEKRLSDDVSKTKLEKNNRNFPNCKS